SLQLKDYLLLAEAWLTLGWVDLLISTVPYRRWRHWIECGDIDEGDNSNPQRACDVALLINRSEAAARHHIRPMNCLRRTVAQKLMLARRGIAVCVHVGVKKEGAGFAAHSWLSHNQKILNDSPDVTGCDRALR
ncbi:MAG: lasso peptide biosynthesis B2 protein, partial [Gammaproteobacteria bacterium]|nr:lasso peptide biosynthesis B2 protein [Gammaproteobacteria bacterium]